MENLRYKFRAWDGHKMFNVDVLAISPCTWDCPDYGKRGVSLAYQSFIKVMQFTGVKDKNEIPIYEGDVLYHPMQGKRKVYYPFMEHVASFGLRNVENGMAGDLSDSHIYEIIGNIYENPELLGGE